MEPTGFCWKCGRQISLDEKLLFCPKPKKCEDLYKREQERYIYKGKKRGYGLAGSTH